MSTRSVVARPLAALLAAAQLAGDAVAAGAAPPRPPTPGQVAGGDVGLASELATELASGTAADLASEVAALVAARCAPCHSAAHPDSAKEPRALRKWGGATDLAAVVATAVVPGVPEESDLYLSVELDEMPPNDSSIAPLSDEEKARVHAWITAGAPLPAPPSGSGADGVPDLGPDEVPGVGPAPRAGEDAAAPEDGPGRGATAGPPTNDGSAAPSSFELAGRFHPLVVHFPIALLLAALPAALAARWRRSAALAFTADYCTALGALGAVAGAALGWCAHEAGAGARTPALLARHEWTGYGAAFLALAALGAAAAARRGRPFGRFHLPLLAAAAAVVAAAGHFGGQLVWGEDFLPLPF